MTASCTAPKQPRVLTSDTYVAVTTGRTAEHVLQPACGAGDQCDGEQHQAQRQGPGEGCAHVALKAAHPHMLPVDFLRTRSRVHLELGVVVGVNACAGGHHGCALRLEQHKPAGGEGRGEGLAPGLLNLCLQALDGVLHPKTTNTSHTGVNHTAHI